MTAQVLFHLSDLHIGTSLMPSTTFRRWPKSGYNSHDHRLLRPLGLAIRDAKSTLKVPDDGLNILISGDLTQAGLDNDYATAVALVHQRWHWRFGPRARLIGFGWARERTISVPGNHDHWRYSTYQTGFTRGLAPDWFDATPWKRVLESSGGGIRVELYGVDSNSGLEDAAAKPGKRNAFAGGRLSDDELFELEAKLAANTSVSRPDQAVVRVLVCHHAFSKTASWIPLLEAGPLAEESRDRLELIS